MPEGVEVQIFVDQLNAHLKNKRLKDVSVLDYKWKSKKFNLLLNTKLVGVSRLAKYLIFEFSDGLKKFYVKNHLAMSGSWVFRDRFDFSPLHTRLIWKFEDQIVDFVDTRRWGKIDILTQEEFFSEETQTALSRLGKDTLTEQITEKDLAEKISQLPKDCEIKPLLMKQDFLAGIGNIYASESCFLAGISPFRKAKSLTVEELANLAEAIGHVMKSAYANGGSTIKTFKDANGRKGWVEHMVYGEKACRICKTAIAKGPQASRTTYWCPKCQLM
jgi:formamidopyrimidine-DNA glycosylase